MLNTFLLLAEAQSGPAAPTQNAPTGSPFELLMPLLGIGVLFYLFILRPARKQEQERQALLNTIKKNDKVITHAGIYGTVVSVSEKEDEIVVKVDDNARLKMIKASIMRNLTNEEAAKEARDKAKTPEKPAEDNKNSTNITAKT